MPHITPPTPRSHMSDSTPIVTNNHVYRKQAIEMGAMYLDLFSAPTNKKKKTQIPKHSTTTTATTEEGFTAMPSELCGLFKPCGKRFRGLKTSQHDVMDWFVNQM